MKRLYFLIIVLGISNFGICQKYNLNGVYVSKDGKEFLIEANKYKLAFTQRLDSTDNKLPYHQTPLSQILYSEGNYNFNKDTITCYDNFNRKFVLKYLNDELLQVIDFGEILKKGDTLFLSLKLSAEKVNNHYSPQFIGSWNNGKKDGWWRYFFNTDSTKIIIYDKGKILDSLWVRSGQQTK